MTTDPIVLAKQREREKREAETKLSQWRQLWPMILIPSHEDRALGYRWVTADDCQIYDEPRKVTPRKALDAARKAGWWAYACQALSLDRKIRTDEIERREQVGIHAFWPSRRIQPGTIGIVAWWSNGAFDWAARADYVDKDGRVVYERTTLGARELLKLFKEG
jgi:hypothetical protein